jgi:hypothetical protein
LIAMSPETFGLSPRCTAPWCVTGIGCCAAAAGRASPQLEHVQPDQRTDAVTATKAAPLLPGPAGSCSAVNQLPKSVVRQIRMLRSVEPEAGDCLRRPGGCENGAMVEPARHRQTKGAATDMLGPKATASHLDSTICVGWPHTDDFRSTPINRHRYRASACLKCAINRNLCRCRIVADVTAYTKKKGRLRRHKRPKSREETPKEGSDSGVLPHNAI